MTLKIILSAVLFAAVSGCGSEAIFQLPDDPRNEWEVPEADKAPPESYPDLPPMQDPDPNDKEWVLQKYNYLDPKKLVPTKLLEEAVLYFDQNQNRIPNKNYLTVIDFSASSKKRRFFIVDMKTGDVWAMTTAHGKGSDKDHDSYAEAFSNTPNSHMSSLGFYLTAETYYGSNGLSLRLDGLSSTNSRARSRAIVVHGASYVVDKEVKQGRSYGCPAVPMEYKDKVIQQIKNGSLMYAGLSKP